MWDVNDESRRSKIEKPGDENDKIKRRVIHQYTSFFPFCLLFRHFLFYLITVFIVFKCYVNHLPLFQILIDLETEFFLLVKNLLIVILKN